MPTSVETEEYKLKLSSSDIPSLHEPAFPVPQISEDVERKQESQTTVTSPLEVTFVYPINYSLRGGSCCASLAMSTLQLGVWVPHG